MFGRSIYLSQLASVSMRLSGSWMPQNDDCPLKGRMRLGCEGML